MELDAETLSRILSAHTASILSQVSAMMGERQHPVAREGIIQNYDPTDGTVEVIFGDGAAIIQGPQGDGDTPPTERRVPLLVTHHGDQFGPVGGERCILVPIQSGYAALIIYDTDDSPNAPAGERWITHRNASGAVDSVAKFTNDGPTTADGLGGLHTGGGALTQNTTAGGHSDTFDDTAKAVTRKSSLGHQMTMNDISTAAHILLQSHGGHQSLYDDTNEILQHLSAGGHLIKINDTGKSISHTLADGTQHILDGVNKVIQHTLPTGEKHVLDSIRGEVATFATKIGLGDYSDTLGASAAAIAKTHMDAFENSLGLARLNDGIAMLNTLHNIGTMTPAQLAAALLVYVPGFLPGITVPSGSSVVHIKS